MRSIRSFFKKNNFPFSLCIFFVFHVIAENNGVDLKVEALILTLKYLFVTAILVVLLRTLYKDSVKASIIVFFLMAFNFFFGSTHDFLKSTFFPGHLIVKYAFLIPASFGGFIILAIYLRKTRRNLSKLVRFLNFLLLFLISTEMAIWLFKTGASKSYDAKLDNQFTPIKKSKPDVFLIIADEYAGKKELKDLFDFDNSAFETELKNRGFHALQNSKANYNATVYSVSSMLNMEYHHGLNNITINERDMFICRALINENHTLDFFQNAGYTIYNFSFFDFGNKKPVATIPFFIPKEKLFTAQTFFDRIKRDIGFNFISQKKITEINSKMLFNNDLIDSLLRQLQFRNKSEPKFVYAHFFMPHHPYYFDSIGRKRPSKTIPSEYDRNAYKDYLLYTNKKLLKIIDFIKTSAITLPIIIIMSDHGFRQFKTPVDQKYYFMNLNAVFLPNGNYSQFYDGMSNVNQFRVILNAQFGQHLPLLSDSTVYLKE